jgi:hypothetical protein
MSPARVQSRDRNPPDCREEGPHTGPGPLLLTIISAQLRVAPGGSDTDITCRQVKKKNISRPRALDSCHTSLLTTRIRERALHVLREKLPPGLDPQPGHRRPAAKSACVPVLRPREAFCACAGRTRRSLCAD